MIKSIERYPEYLLLRTEDGLMRIEPYSPSVVRVVYTLETGFRNAPSLIVLPGCKEPAEWDVSETDRDIVFSTQALSVSVNRATGAFAYRDSSGKLLAREPDRGGKTLDRIDVVKTVFIASEKVETVIGIDGLQAEARESKRVVDRQAYHTKLEFVWDEKEALYGLGSHEEGMMNLRGGRQYLYQENLKASVPVLVSTNGYGILVDSCSLMTFHDDAFGSYLWCDVEDEMDYCFIHGPEFDDIIRSCRKLTGQAPLLPRWAFGYVQSKERYVSQEELIDVAQEYRRREIPLDALVLDWLSWTGNLWGQKTLDPERFPDPDGMMKSLHGLSVKLMVSIWPNMSPGGENHAEMREHGFLLGDRTHYDAFQSDARALYWKQADEGLFRHGIDAWWCDCTEPFDSDWKGAVKPEPEERMALNASEAKKYLDPEFINAYSIRHCEGIYEGQRKKTDSKRVVNLTRSSMAGQHRYAAITWSGDISANWETLRRQIPAGLNFCATGEPYWTADIGAFFAGGKSKWSRWCRDASIPAPWFLDGDYDGGVDDLGYRELYVRWFQYGAFLPMFRAHGTDTPREIWRFGEPGSVFFDTLLKFDRLRYRLLPYIYSLAGMTTLDSYTMMRALAFDFRNDPNVYDIEDQYMFGPAFMVCPVTKPMYYGPYSQELHGVPKTRSVYLPSGCGWYDFWTGELYKGGQRIEAAAPLEIMPLFVREGSVIPMGPMAQSSRESGEGPLELRVYPGADGEFTLYEDAGDGYDYERGDYVLLRISWEDKANRLTAEKMPEGNRKMVFRRQMSATMVSRGEKRGAERKPILS